MSGAYWQEDRARGVLAEPGDAIDVMFALSGATVIPVDHAYALSQAVIAALPWLTKIEGAGLHLIRGADSGNGWQRPEGEQELLYLARRTRLKLRIPRAYVTEAAGLTGTDLEISGQRFTVGSTVVREIAPAGALYAHHVVDTESDEPAFLESAVAEFHKLGVACKKMLCGKSRSLALPDDRVRTRSLMVADMSSAESVVLQCRGLGPRRLLGCGLFVPHKGVRQSAL